MGEGGPCCLGLVLLADRPHDSRGNGVLVLRGSSVLRSLAVVLAVLMVEGCFAFSVVSVWAVRSNSVVMTVGDTEVFSQVSF